MLALLTRYFCFERVAVHGLKLATLLRLCRSSDGFFMEAHPKLRPVDTATGGVYLAGCCKGPNGIRDIIVQADMLLKSAHPGRSRKAQEVAGHRPRWG